jgi:hypothetical protein
MRWAIVIVGAVFAQFAQSWAVVDASATSTEASLTNAAQAIQATPAPALKARAITALPSALKSANYASILNTTCAASITPTYTSYKSGKTIKSFPVVGCSSSSLVCHADDSTISISGTYSACCPKYVQTLFMLTSSLPIELVLTAALSQGLENLVIGSIVLLYLEWRDSG